MAKEETILKTPLRTNWVMVKGEQANQSKNSTVSKYCRFELEPENIEN